jgi:hypothetical protein
MARPKKINAVYVVVPTEGDVSLYREFSDAFTAANPDGSATMVNFVAPTGRVEKATLSNGTRIQLLVIV